MQIHALTHSLTDERRRGKLNYTLNDCTLYCALVITTTDHSNRSDSPHRRRGIDRSNVFARRRHCEHQSNGRACFLGPTRVCPPNGISIGSAVIAVTNTQKHRPRKVKTCVGIARIWHCERRCGLITLTDSSDKLDWPAVAASLLPPCE